MSFTKENDIIYCPYLDLKFGEVGFAALKTKTFQPADDESFQYVDKAVT